MSIAFIILNFLKKNMIPILITLLAVSVFIYIQSLKSDILEYEIKTIKLTNNLTLCNDTIKNRNNVIETWSTESNSQKVQMNSLKNEIKLLSKTTNNNIQKILTNDIPKTCEEATKYFIDMGKRYE